MAGIAWSKRPMARSVKAKLLGMRASSGRRPNAVSRAASEPVRSPSLRSTTPRSLRISVSWGADLSASRNVATASLMRLWSIRAMARPFSGPEA